MRGECQRRLHNRWLLFFSSVILKPKYETQIEEQLAAVHQFSLGDSAPLSDLHPANKTLPHPPADFKEARAYKADMTSFLARLQQLPVP